MSRPKQTDKEKKAKAAFLKNEKITGRTKRVLNPRINRLRKQIKDLTKAIASPRYEFSTEQAEKLVSALTNDIAELQTAISSASETKIEDIL